jgi:UV DNA damage endonuclease
MSSSTERPVQLGLCCMNVTLKKQKPPVYAARRIIMKTIEKLGIEELKKRTLQNLEDLLKMLHWNTENGIRVFRLSSEMFQHKTNPRVQDYTYDFALEHLKKIGDYAKSVGMRLTMHPGQWNNLGSPNQKVVDQTFKDLNYHCGILDMMGMGKDSVMVIHGGGVYGDKQGAMKRWVENYLKLPKRIKDRLVLENCEKSYSIKDCLKLSWRVNIPVVFDTHHFECYKKLHPNESFKSADHFIPLILDTWSRKNIKPKFHVSEQGSGKIGHHSDYIEILPKYLLEIPEKYGVNIDIMIEAKMKELSIQKLYIRYPETNCLKDNPYYHCKEIMEGIVDGIVDNVDRNYNRTIVDDELREYINSNIADPFSETEFKGYTHMNPKQKGMFGELYVSKLMIKNNHSVEAPTNTGHDRIIDCYKTELKFSLASKGIHDCFTLNHISLCKDWERLIFTGINVDGNNRMYWMDKTDFISNINSDNRIFNYQQGGKKGENDDYMIMGKNVMRLIDIGLFRSMETW